MVWLKDKIAELEAKKGKGCCLKSRGDFKYTVEEKFLVFDTNGNGSLDYDEFKKFMLETIDSSMSEKLLKSLFKKCDKLD